MTHQRDPDTRRGMRNDNGWGMLPMLLGVAAIALLAIYFFMPSNTRDRTVLNADRPVTGPVTPGMTPAPPATPAPTKTP